MTNHINDLSISGMGKANGGKFNNVDISGLGKIIGDIEAERISVSGKGTIEGNTIALRKINISGMGTITGSLKSDFIDSSGTGLIQGDLEGRYIESSGNLKIEGTATLQELVIDGRCRVGKKLKSEKIVSRGYLSVGTDVETEEFQSQGSFTIDGLLNANFMNIDIYGFCQAKEIGGEEIFVRKPNTVSLNFLSKIINPFLGNGKELDKLTSDLIEGTVVQLEHTHAKIVRGNNVKIGAECIIDVVEYTDTLEIDSSSMVKKQIKI